MNYVRISFTRFSFVTTCYVLFFKYRGWEAICNLFLYEHLIKLTHIEEDFHSLRIMKEAPLYSSLNPMAVVKILFSVLFMFLLHNPWIYHK